MPTAFRREDSDQATLDERRRSLTDETPDREQLPRTSGPSLSGDQTAPDHEPGTTSANGSGFVNFDQYYNANADSAQKSASQLAQNAWKQGQDTENNIDNAFRKFSDQAAEGTNTAPSNLSVGGSLNNAFDPTRPETAQPQAQPAGQVSPEEARSGAQRGYSGPGSLLDAQFGDLTGQVENANQNLNALGSSEGLQSLYQNQGDNQGESQLDAALSGRAGAQQFRDTRDRFGSLEGFLSKKADAANSLADSGRKISDNARGAYSKAIENYDKARAAREGQESAANTTKPKSYEDYLAYSPQEFIKTLGKNLSTIDSGMDVITGNSIVDNQTKSYEGNSGASDAAGAKTAFNYLKVTKGDASAKKVYDSMTPDELASLEKMGQFAAGKWLLQRAAELGIK